MQSSILKLITISVFAGSALAQTAEVALPQVRGPLPVSETDYPLGAADRYVTPRDLAALGYVEEEYIISGDANVYRWSSDNQSLEIETTGAPYVNRILVRRPADRFDFSGTVVVEMFNTARRFDWPMIWGYSADYFLQNRDIWIGVSGPNSVEGLKQFNAARYGDLSFANPQSGTCPGSDRQRGAMENGLKWDMMAQIAALVKTDSVAGFLPEFEVKRVYLTSQNNEMETYINGFHDRWRMADGAPLYDAYFIKSPTAPAPVNDCAPALAEGDPRRQLKDVDVPVMQVLTQGEVLASAWNRKEDSDMPESRLRRYEIAAAAHIDAVPYRAMPKREDQIAAVGNAQGTEEWPFDVTCMPDIELQQFPLLKFVMNSAFQNLERWAHYNIRPPYAKRITIQNEGTPQASLTVNEFGIAEGGVRTPYTEYPTARYETNMEGPGVCAELGTTHPFTRAQIEERYGSLEEYSQTARQSADRTFAARWIIDGDYSELIRDIIIDD